MRQIGPLRREDGSIYQHAAPATLDDVELDATQKAAMYLEMALQVAQRGLAAHNRHYFGDLIERIQDAKGIATDVLTWDAHQRGS